MIRTSDDRDMFQARFAEVERQASANGSAWFEPRRREAMACFESLGWPTPRQEAWRHFDAGPLRRTTFRYVHDPERVRIGREALAQFQVHCLPGAQLVFVDGYFEPALSSARALPPTVFAGDLASAIGHHRVLLEGHLARHAAFATQPFVALNTALLHDGACVHVPRGVTVKDPIHVLFLSTGARGPTVSHPRTIVLLEEQAQLTLVEDFVSLGNEVHFTNPVTEVVLDRGASLDYYKLQRENKSALHVGAIEILQAADSSFQSTSIAFGGSRTRNDLRCVLNGEGSSCALHGLNVIGDHQMVDDFTTIVHAQPHGTSQELYKSILDGHAEGVFHGTVFVAKDAQKTSSRQVNRNLVLSKDALMNTKPELQIHADDVKCSHGATIGELEEDALFYLRTRGLDAKTARRILTYAFANDVLEHIRLEPLRKTVESDLFHFIPAGMEAKRPC